MESKRILLIAEDDPDDQILIQDAVEDACPQDVETWIVWDGIELMAYLHGAADEARKPDLVLLDLNMPRKDGRAALSEIKADPNLADIPIAILTTSNAEVDAEYCRQFGVVGYFRKPGSMTELREIISSLCKNYLN